MFSPLGAVDEYGLVEEALPALPGDTAGEATACEVPEVLEPVDYRILALLFQGKTIDAVAAEVERGRTEITLRIERPRFTHLKGQVEKGIVAEIAKGGEFEPITIARVNASPAMRRIINLSKTSRDPRVYLQANKEVLRFAGAEPPRKLELVTPDKVLDEMTPEELAHFANTREWPLRFKDKLAQFLKYEGGEVTLTESKSVTFAAGHGAQKDSEKHPTTWDETPDETLVGSALAKPKPQTHHQAKLPVAGETGKHLGGGEADETIVVEGKPSREKPYQAKLPFIGGVNEGS
jgi:hypothetical protein